MLLPQLEKLVRECCGAWGSSKGVECARRVYVLGAAVAEGTSGFLYLYDTYNVFPYLLYLYTYILIRCRTTQLHTVRAHKPEPQHPCVCRPFHATSMHMTCAYSLCRQAQDQAFVHFWGVAARLHLGRTTPTPVVGACQEGLKSFPDPASDQILPAPLAVEWWGF